MRLALEDKTRLPAHSNRIRSICEWVSSNFTTIKGHVRVIVRKIRRGYKHTDHGCYYHGSRRAKVFVNFTEGLPSYPSTVTERRYFRHASGNPIPYTLNNWSEALVHILSHELAHGTKANRRMRRSRQELHSENKGSEMLELFRTPEVQAIISDRVNELEKSQLPELDEGPDLKLIGLQNKKIRWESKLKRAQNAIKKVERKIKYYERKMLREPVLT